MPTPCPCGPSGSPRGARAAQRVAAGRAAGHTEKKPPIPARLWFNDAAAKSRFDVTLGGTTTSFYLLDGYHLGMSPGSGPKKTIDVFVDRLAGGNPWKPFGTWSRTY